MHKTRARYSKAIKRKFLWAIKKKKTKNKTIKMIDSRKGNDRFKDIYEYNFPECAFAHKHGIYSGIL